MTKENLLALERAVPYFPSKLGFVKKKPRDDNLVMTIQWMMTIITN